MSAEVHELAIRMTPEGGDEVRDELETTRGEFEQTTEEVGDSTSRLDKFANKWTGAGLVFAGTLGTLTAAIASRMPIIDEISNSLGLVLDSLALKIDESVRPTLSDLTNDFADLAEEIDNTESAPEAVGTALAGLVEIIEDRDPISASVVVNFTIEAGAVFLEEIDWEKRIEEKAKFTPTPVIAVPLKLQLDLTVATLEALGIDVKALNEKWLLFVSNLRTIAEKGIVLIQTAFKTGWDLIVNEAKQFLNELGQRFEDRVNDIISALNRIPGQHFSKVSIGQFETTSTQEIIRRRGQEAQTRLNLIEARRRTRNDQIERLIAALESGEQTTEVSVNERGIGRVSGSMLGDNIASLGR